MAITSLTQTPFGRGAVRVVAVSDDGTPSFRWYLDGRLIEISPVGTRVFTVPLDEILFIEVLDDDTPPRRAWPAYILLQWRAVTGAAEYRVEESIASVWTARATIRERGTAYYSWRTRALEDGTVHAFRIIPVGTNGNDGTALARSVLMVRRPDPPRANERFSDSTHKVTVEVL